MGVETGVDVSIGAGWGADAGADVEIGAGVDAVVVADEEANMDAGTDAETGVEANADVEAGVGASAEAGAETNAEARTEVDSDADSGVVVWMQTQTQKKGNVADVQQATSAAETLLIALPPAAPALCAPAAPALCAPAAPAKPGGGCCARVPIGAPPPSSQRRQIRVLQLRQVRLLQLHCSSSAIHAMCSSRPSCVPRASISESVRLTVVYGGVRYIL